MRDYTEHRTPIREFGRMKQILSEESLANVDVRAYEDHVLRQMIVEMQAFALHGAPQEITLRETVEVEATAEVTATARATTVDGVWAAICVYWLAPMLAWLGDFLRAHTRWNWERTRDAENWAWEHTRAVSSTKTATNTETEQRTAERTQTVHRTMCPHVPTEERHHHLRWIDTHDPRVPFPDADSVRQAFENLLYKDDLTYGAAVVVDAEEYMALTRMSPNDPVPLRQFMGMDILVEGVNAFRLEYDR